MFRREHLEEALAKAAASAPTRGNFMMASDIPAFRPPRLDRALQKESDFEDELEKATPKPAEKKAAKKYKLMGDALIEVDEKGHSLGKGNILEKDNAFMPDGVTYNMGDFKRSKYAMPLEEMSEFVAELRKESSVGSPAAQLAKTQRIGAPKASAPPGPSIAEIAKPAGARFGSGIPGARKGVIGGWNQAV